MVEKRLDFIGCPIRTNEIVMNLVELCPILDHTVIDAFGEDSAIKFLALLEGEVLELKSLTDVCVHDAIEFLVVEVGVVVVVCAENA